MAANAAGLRNTQKIAMASARVATSSVLRTIRVRRLCVTRFPSLIWRARCILPRVHRAELRSQTNSDKFNSDLGCSKGPVGRNGREGGTLVRDGGSSLLAPLSHLQAPQCRSRQALREFLPHVVLIRRQKHPRK